MPIAADSSLKPPPWVPARALGTAAMTAAPAPQKAKNPQAGLTPTRVAPAAPAATSPRRRSSSSPGRESSHRLDFFDPNFCHPNLFDNDLLEALSHAYWITSSRLGAVIASGGVATLEDLRRLLPLEKDGVEGVVVGRALYAGAFSLKEATALASEPSTS